jgi:hypothetical protein
MRLPRKQSSILRRSSVTETITEGLTPRTCRIAAEKEEHENDNGRMPEDWLKATCQSILTPRDRSRSAHPPAQPVHVERFVWRFAHLPRPGVSLAPAAGDGARPVLPPAEPARDATVETRRDSLRAPQPRVGAALGGAVRSLARAGRRSRRAIITERSVISKILAHLAKAAAATAAEGSGPGPSRHPPPGPAPGPSLN